MKILFVGDLVGSPGRAALAGALPLLAERWDGFDFVVVNCENAAAGKGMTEKIMEELFRMGVHGMTSGNHIWDKNIFYPALASETRVIRPANCPPGCPGTGHAIIERNGKRLGLLNLQGRVFMPPIDCPFRTADSVLPELGDVPILVDFHAEATSEKKALALYLDGRVSALVGTHTHVQTADERVLPGGTASISDVGMTGGHGGIIGMKTENVLPRYLTGMPAKFEVCDEDLQINAVVIEIDDETGRALNIVRVSERVDTR
ncbi:MAG: TIGR00282 family metallophosphoesterase [Synergistaceae bacterium]|jgi:metallophosphoesterase (TIGR00282 family)|nr:TIGR00282 family metallophosphoesterase [Synergistaceae bacterium]